MKAIDWIIHYVADGYCEECDRVEDGFVEYACNAHTHGMAKYGHKDFQIVLNIPVDDIGAILNTLGKRVQNGETFHDGDYVSGIYEDCQIKLLEFEEGGRMLLRVIIPDNNGVFPDEEGCIDILKIQMWPTDLLYIDSGVIC